MLTVEDFKHFSDTSPSDIEAIKEHEHITSSVACEMAASLSSSPEGCRTMLRHFVDDIARAEEHKAHKHAYALRIAMNQFIASHDFV